MTTPDATSVIEARMRAQEKSSFTIEAIGTRQRSTRDIHSSAW